MFAAKPAQFFVAKLSVGRDCGSLFLLSPANDEGGQTFEPIGTVAKRVLQSVKKARSLTSREDEADETPSNSAPVRRDGSPARLSKR